MWLKMAFKMSQEFPTASVDITEDFHVMAFWVTLYIIQINQTASYVMNDFKICNKSEFYYSL